MLNLFIGVIIDNFNHLKQQVRKLKTIHGSIELVNDVLEIYRLLFQSREGASNDDRLLTLSIVIRARKAKQNKATQLQNESSVLKGEEECQ